MTVRIALPLIVTVALCLSILTPPVSAQNYWMQPGDENSLTLEFFHPVYDSNGDIGGPSEDWGILTSALVFSGRIAVSPTITLVADLPMANIDMERNYYSYDTSDVPYLVSSSYQESQFGNPYLGVEAGLPMGEGAQQLILRGGIRLPLAEETESRAGGVGYTTLWNRAEAFLPDITTVEAGLGWQGSTEDGLRYNAGADIALWMSSDDNRWSGDETYINYNTEIWYAPNKLGVGAGFAGRYHASSDSKDADKSEHQLAFAANYDLGKVTPGICFRIPVEERLTEILDYVVGLNVTYDL